MLKRIAINIGSGYGQKVIQTICGLITVPILLSDSGLGVRGYGELAVALSISALVSTMYDGFRLTASRRIGLSDVNFRAETYRITVWILLVTLPAALLLIAFSSTVFALSGLDAVSEMLIYLIAIVILIEQSSYVIEQSFHASLKTTFVSTLNSIEVLTRLIAISAIFVDGQQTIDTYFVIVAITSALKLGTMWLATTRYPTSDRDFRPTSFSTFVRESIPLSLNGISITLVFRLSIILSNRLFSAEMAAVFSIIILTIRNYINQLFVSVIRPMVIPLVSRLNLRNATPGRIDIYNNAVSLYEVTVTVLTIFLAASTKLWLPAWLGDDLARYAPLVALSIIAIGLESAMSLKSMTLVAQGLGRHVTMANTICSLIYFFALLALHSMDLMSLESLSIATCMYLIICNGFLINAIYYQKIVRSRKSIFTTISAIIACPLVYSTLSAESDRLSQTTLLFVAWVSITVLLLSVNSGQIRETWRYCQAKSS